ncbi:MAG TPA: CPBP family intramembrane glutamic endopeptidase [Verrucomicrobiae bacterium]|nr:CPBP family intramembrane glutamic endopeptidase [Verrucomicrobiae bacterium]
MPARAVVGVAAALAITTAMDATGYSAFSALPLFPLLAVFWALDRFPRRDVGFALAGWRPFGLALLYPAAVIGSLALIAFAAGAVDLSRTDWAKAWTTFERASLATFLVAILTEEGFFRGWLWASLGRAGLPRDRVLVFTSLAFAAWHISAVTLDTGFNPPMPQVPVFLVNAAVMGVGWGLLRRISGSVVVTSLSHGLWNGLAYVFFGFGTKVGVLGVANTALFGPEVGVLGLALNAAFVAALWTVLERQRLAVPVEDRPGLA